jgi:transcriptional regulator with XRE-family HTH domain
MAQETPFSLDSEENQNLENEQNNENVNQNNDNQQITEDFITEFILEQELQAITLKIKELIRAKGWQDSRFADTIGVQRSSISHLLSGRNKAGIELIMRILKFMPDVNLYWLLANDAVIFKNEMLSDSSEEDVYTNGIFQEKQTPKTQKNKELQEEKRKKNKSKEIQRVMVFYTDGTFDNFKSLLE